MPANSQLPFVKLKAKRNSVHPWIFLKMVARPQKKVNPGTIVKIISKEDEFLGYGFYNRKSNINIRVLSENESEEIDQTFFEKKIDTAVDLRKNILNIETGSDSYRLISAEADGLSGLFVDKLGDVIVVEPFSAGYLHCMDWVINALQKHYPQCSILVRSDEKNSLKEGIDLSKLDKKYPGPKKTIVKENQIQMSVNLETGHKTGFFLDQRENRKYLAQMSKGKDVLDICCYTGGFAISALKEGASSATGVDLDEKAIEVAQENSKLNSVQPSFVHANGFDFLREQKEAGNRYDIVILDPPKLARNKEELGRAKRDYNDLNRLGIDVVKDGGILLTCSCTGSLAEGDFLSIISRAANEAQANLQFFKIAGPGEDHPYSHYFPEGRYLKAVYARVTRPYRTSGYKWEDKFKEQEIK